MSNFHTVPDAEFARKMVGNFPARELGQILPFFDQTSQTDPFKILNDNSKSICLHRIYEYISFFNGISHIFCRKMNTRTTSFRRSSNRTWAKTENETKIHIWRAKDGEREEEGGRERERKQTAAT